MIDDSFDSIRSLWRANCVLGKMLELQLNRLDEALVYCLAGEIRKNLIMTSTIANCSM